MMMKGLPRTAHFAGEATPTRKMCGMATSSWP